VTTILRHMAGSRIWTFSVHVL